MKSHKHKHGNDSMRNDTHETRIALLELSIKHINETLIRLENKMDNHFKELKQDINDLRKEGLAHFRWTLLFILAMLSSPIVSSILKYYHWFQ